MASIQYVVNATDAASAVFAKIAASADGLDSQLEDLSKRVATPEVDLKDSKFTLGIVNAAKRLDKLSAMVADPSVHLDGAKAQVEILRINSMLDRLDRKHVTAHVKVDVDRPGFLKRTSTWGGLGKTLTGLLPGVAGAAGGAAGGGAEAAGGAAGGIFSNPQTAIPAVAAGLTALPFIAQAAAGGIVAALGGGLTLMAVIGAAKAKSVRNSFAGLKKSANHDLAQIGKPFIPVLNSIVKTAESVLGGLTPVFKSAAGIIAGPFKTFADTLLKAFGQPAVKTSVKAVASAFAAILKALTPTLAGDVKSVANGITNIAKAVSANPKAFSTFISFLFRIAGGALDIIAALTRVATWIEAHWNVIKWIAFPVLSAVQLVVAHWNTLRHETAVIFDGVRHEIAHVWDMIWNNTIGAGIRIVAGVHKWVAGMRHDIATQFDTIRHDIATVWDAIWNNTVGRVKRGIGDVIGWFEKLPGRAVTALAGLGTKLYNLGSGWLTSMWNGIRHIWDSVLGWFRNLPHAILHALGIASPPHWAVDAGKHIMNGIALGMKGTLHTVLGLAGNLGHLITTSVGSLQLPLPKGIPAGPHAISGAVGLGRAMAAARGWTGTQWDALFALWERESGWNPAARNPSSGAAGIVQDITGNFHGGALGQILWGLNYIQQRYGSPVAAWAHETRFGWYDRGGWLPPGVSLALNTTGRPERVGGGNTVININVRPTPLASPADIGREVATVLAEFKKRGGMVYRPGGF